MNIYTKLFASAFSKKLMEGFPMTSIVDKVKLKKHTYITIEKIENEKYIYSWLKNIPYIDDKDLVTEYEQYLSYIDSLIHKVFKNDYIFKYKLQDKFLKFIRKEIGIYSTSECKTTEDILIKLSFLIDSIDLANDKFIRHKERAIKKWDDINNFADQHMVHTPYVTSTELKVTKKTIKGKM